MNGKTITNYSLGPRKLGDHVCSIEVTAKYRSVFTIIKGSYFQDFGDRSIQV